ncbi:bifunctional hydroxyacyl-CoA dehydrogenase/enoyl-CoA hydratase FOX2 [Kluyveromyces lactis]|uniref:KLLA0E13817p n=1 Tax=Kluyveromyces lactis (strain ATCC 8585 / CBS 2359 / DSM 70799 / NBRC 1267 / NRRL Y-1140 / WM37) TaxID=284590 RepID=Q6CNB5_KLULA|nr:uncharacterized protein KLLA0_E13817g [Kluyveromyces lactis]CAG99661.1 KLLA0E13817p [Kluyveromyces lactis]|eukprot:XP_454574.1 uncharacterized protein KLLA0_E13817g [Kluyveromyces lactis]
MSLEFKDRVVIITGAGGGLGRVYALEYAKRGGKVVVNDLGRSAADSVVQEIKKLGGEGDAVANYDSVSDNGAAIVETAISNFGRVDILINNAGILRDSSFAKMSEKQFQQVIDVHLNGAFKLTRAAWPHMRKQKFGRIINTCSPAGLYGNFGQANYSAAKLGLLGFGESLAKEGYKYNINVNSIAPLARSAMTENVIPANILKELGPEKIAPLILYLTHENTKVTNNIFELAAGFYSQIRWERSSGELFHPNVETLTPETILPKFNKIIEFKDKPFNKVQHPIELSNYNDLITKARELPENKNGPIPIKSLRGKVVIITGSGSGLGKSHAQWFARYGAKVVINDIRDPSAVVDEINKKYGSGSAVADTHDIVKEAQQVVQTAVDKFGRVDILVNNAGILRDRSFAKMTEDEWNAVINVHLFSTFALSKAVWPIFLKQKSGYIINTTSTSGIYGNFGQCNYAAAKAAILGFSRTLALEGTKRGITVNVIAPHAETAMTKTIFSSKELNNHFDPGFVSPFVVLLCSDELQELGKNRVKGLLFEVGGGWCGLTRWQRSRGIVNSDATPEYLAEHWKELTDFSKGTMNPSSTQESSMAILQSVHKHAADKAKPKTYKYTSRDVILYNLGLGATTRELQYTYENHPQFQVLPTFATIPYMADGSIDIKFDELVDNFNYAMLLHGEQYFKINKFPLPTSGELRTTGKPLQVLGKSSKAAIIVGGYETVDAKTNEPVIYNEGTFFVRNAVVPDNKVINKAKERSPFATKAFVTKDLGDPDFEAEISTFEDQAALYRLSGDYNPLHIDPQLAKSVKFPKPILHGLCTLGVSAKELFEKYGPFDELKARFTNVVFPGDRLKVKAWKKNDVVIFQTTDLNTGKIVLDNSAIKLIGKSKL